jgi:hypothetical protein
MTNKQKAAANMGLASYGVTCLNSSAVFQINFSAGLTVLCPEIPHERQAQKLYWQNKKCNSFLSSFFLLKFIVFDFPHLFKTHR